MNTSKGSLLREKVQLGNILQFIGVYDAFSASLAAEHYDNLFVSGFGFSASHYGLPDQGFVVWPDLLDFVRRLVAVLPKPHLLIDIDDGFCDPVDVGSVVESLNHLGASGVVLEDQARPRRCGHVDGKLILPLESYLEKLKAALARKGDMLVVARTDAGDENEIKRRVVAFRDAGCDAVLADGIRSIALLKEIRGLVDCPVAFNQIAGGKSPTMSLAELHNLGVNMAIYSTPCLFAAQTAIRRALLELSAANGSLASATAEGSTLSACNDVLLRNLPPSQT